MNFLSIEMLRYEVFDVKLFDFDKNVIVIDDVNVVVSGVYEK